MFQSGDGVIDPECLYDGELSAIGEPEAKLELRGKSRKVKASSPSEAIQIILDEVTAAGMPGLEAVGYRVVHPGAKLQGHQRVTPEVLKDLEEAAEFAPLHDPAVVEVIRAVMARFKSVPHYACFDTVFHQTMPEEATIYPLPREYREQGVRR